MKFNKLAKELNLSVNELAEQVADILPNANGGTEVSEEQKTQIITLLQAPTADSTFSLLTGGFTPDGTDPILSVLIERIEQEAELETPEQLVDQMIARYIANPDVLPADAEYREAIITYVALVKKRKKRRQQQSSKLRPLLSSRAREGSTPLALETFYSAEPNDTNTNAAFSSNSPSPQLAAAGS